MYSSFTATLRIPSISIEAISSTNTTGNSSQQEAKSKDDDEEEWQ